MDRISRIRYQPGLRNLSGLAYAWSCAIPHWAGVLLACNGLMCLVSGEYFIRVPVAPGPYLLNALIGFAGPVLLLAWSDWYSIRTYLSTGSELREPGIRTQLLEPQAVAGLRRELRASLLLRWFAPRATQTTRDQAKTLIHWYDELRQPEGTQLRQRIRVKLLATGFIAIPLLVGGLLLTQSHTGFQLPWEALGQPRTMFGWALLPLGISSLLAGYHMVRFAARKQAVLDCFALWKSETQAES